MPQAQRVRMRALPLRPLIGCLSDPSPSMAAALPQVGLMEDGDLGVELEFDMAAGSDKRALKSQL